MFKLWKAGLLIWIAISIIAYTKVRRTIQPNSIADVEITELIINKGE